MTISRKSTENVVASLSEYEAVSAVHVQGDAGDQCSNLTGSAPADTSVCCTSPVYLNVGLVLLGTRKVIAPNVF